MNYSSTINLVTAHMREATSVVLAHVSEVDKSEDITPDQSPDATTCGDRTDRSRDECEKVPPSEQPMDSATLAAPLSAEREIVHAEASNPPLTGSQDHYELVAISDDPRARSRRHDRNADTSSEVVSSYDEEYPYWDHDADVASDTQRNTDPEPEDPNLVEPPELSSPDNYTYTNRVTCSPAVDQSPGSKGGAYVRPMTAQRQSCDNLHSSSIVRERTNASSSTSSISSPMPAYGHETVTVESLEQCLNGRLTTEQWRWYKTCDDGTQLTAVQYADDLVVSHIHHPEIQGLLAELRIDHKDDDKGQYHR
jgi:hypothetical protein